MDYNGKALILKDCMNIKDEKIKDDFFGMKRKQKKN